MSNWYKKMRNRVYYYCFESRALHDLASCALPCGTGNECKTEFVKDLSDCFVTGVCFLEHLCLALCSLNEMTVQQCDVCDKMSCQLLSPASYPLRSEDGRYFLLSPALNQFSERRLKSLLTSHHFQLAGEPWIEIRLQSIDRLCHYRISSTYSMVTHIWKLAQ